MGINKNEIFLASRFEEFKDLRRLLREQINNHEFMTAVDLNNNQASHRSPLSESLFYVRKSEIMVLLVGETYGTIPDDEKYSYTHLEYKEAVKETSNTRVLVFCIGQSYTSNEINYSDDDNMRNWQKELEKNHRLKKFSGLEKLEYISEQIFIDILSSLYDLNKTRFSDDTIKATEENITIYGIDNEEDFLQNQEVDFLDSKNSEILGIELINEDELRVEGFELLKIPNKLAAIEQKKEAYYAIEINDYATAIKHLKNALALKPLDFESNYWLAKLYITTAKKSLFYNIEEFLLRAARIAEKRNNHFKASHCYQLIVQASVFSDREEEGMKYLALAQELTPNFSKLFYEKTKFMLHFGHFDKAEQALIETLNIKMESVELIENDPFFNRYTDFIAEVLQKEKETLFRTCYAILSKTNQARQLFSMKTIPISLNDNTLTELWKKSRNGVFMQYNIVSSKIKNTSESQKIELENEIQMLQKKHTNDVHIFLKKLSDDERIVKKDCTNKINALESELKNDKRSTVEFVGFLLVVFIGIFLYTFSIGNDKLNIFTLISLLPLLFGAVLIYIFFRKVRNTTREIERIQKEQNNKIEILRSEYIEITNELERESENNKMIIIERLHDLEQEYKNIKTALETFESETVTVSKSKFIPFKSLKNAIYNSIIRVTPSSYKNYKESGAELEIIEDFPEYLNIDRINPEQSSFLAKVVSRRSTYIKLSRVQAYNE